MGFDLEGLIKKKKLLQQTPAAPVKGGTVPVTPASTSTGSLTGMAEGLAVGAVGGFLAKKKAGQMQNQGLTQQEGQGLVQNPGASAPVSPPGGPVGDAMTAIAIAENAAASLYGKGTVDAKKPLSARLDGDTWVVTGKEGAQPNSILEIRVSAKDGKVIGISNGG